MLEHDFLDLDGRDVLAAGDDDVLGAILDLDVAVGMGHGEIAGPVPAAGERLIRRLRIFQISLHAVVAAEQNFADRRAVMGQRFQRHRVRDDHIVGHHVAHALPRHQL